MHISIIATSNKDPQWVSEACDIYLKRLPASMQPKISILPVSAKQNQQMLDRVPSGNNIIALDERGESWSTKKLADKMNGWMVNGSDISFLIGGADGLSDACRNKANTLWSLSPLTLPHAMARVVLLEQLYRAWSILQNHPYHREG